MGTDIRILFSKLNKPKTGEKNTSINLLCAVYQTELDIQTQVN